MNNDSNEKCPHCGNANTPSMLICRHCYRLLVNLSKENKTIRLSDHVNSYEIDDHTQSKEHPGAANQEGLLELRASHSEDVITVNVKQAGMLLVGRKDAARNIEPDVDLTDYQGAKLGVSRCHAYLQWRGGHIYISDLNSSNGTYVNERRIGSAMPHVLFDQDSLHLGELKLVVSLM